MVIHDLKHPAESQISQLETLENQIMDHISNMDTIIQKTYQLENEIAKAQESEVSKRLSVSPKNYSVNGQNLYNSNFDQLVHIHS